jgi:diguanylate cyclase (GGDEF)-like protein
MTDYGTSILLAVSLAVTTFMSAKYIRERKHRLELSRKFDSVLKQMSDNLEYDKLTGLLTRLGFSASIERAAHKVDSDGSSFCILYIGLDNFGLFNDAFGHHVGDLLLKEVSRRLTAVIGVNAKICRITAGEFALIASGGSAIGLDAAKRVTSSLSVPFTFDSIKATVSSSIGISVYPEQGSSNSLLGYSATAMRSVKLSGGGDSCQYDPKMGFEVHDQAVLVNDLRNALELGQFELYFQPKVDAISLEVTAAEALLRWHHPERGMVNPSIFIPLAERFGLIGPIGNWVIQEACRVAGGWRKKGLRMRVAVNISGYQMREVDLVERIEAAIERNGIQPGRFTCEITESVAMEDTKVTQLTFEKMRRAGFHVSIDDFGTGYSSLAVLRKLPAAELKIDRAFVSDLEDSVDARSIAQSIIGLATSLNLHVVAEGVETEGQRDLLVMMGCNDLQGFLFSVPVPADVIERMALEGILQGAVPFSKCLFTETRPAELLPV